MLTAEGYQLAWIIYLGSVIALSVCFFFLLGRFFGRALVIGFEVFVVAILLVPVSAEPGSEFLAPALIVGIFEFISLGPDEVARTVRPLTVMGGGVLVLEVLIFSLIYFLKNKLNKQIDMEDI